MALRLRGPRRLEAIGHELDPTRERVRQLEAQALTRLSALRELSLVAVVQPSVIQTCWRVRDLERRIEGTVSPHLDRS